MLINQKTEQQLLCPSALPLTFFTFFRISRLLVVLGVEAVDEAVSGFCVLSSKSHFIRYISRAPVPLFIVEASVQKLSISNSRVGN